VTHSSFLSDFGYLWWLVVVAGGSECWCNILELIFCSFIFFIFFYAYFNTSYYNMYYKLYNLKGKPRFESTFRIVQSLTHFEVTIKII